MSDPIAFSALLCSRLCHDLISPVGAFTNGIEILQDESDADMRVQVMDLLEQSARQTSSRLQFFRMAFGAAGGFGETIAMDQVKDVAAAYFSGGKIDLSWNPLVQELSKDGMKIILNLLLLAGESLLRGGRLSIEGARSNGCLEISVTAEGDRLLFKDEVADTLVGKTAQADLTPKTAPAYLAYVTAEATDGTIELVRHNDERLSLILRLP